MDFSFDEYELPLLNVFDNFWLKVNFNLYYNGYSSLIFGIICLKKKFPVFYSEVVTVFFTEVWFLYAAKCFLPHVSLCLFIRELSPLMLRDIKDQRLLLPVVLLLDVELHFCGSLLGLLLVYFLTFSSM